MNAAAARRLLPRKVAVVEAEEALVDRLVGPFRGQPFQEPPP